MTPEDPGHLADELDQQADRLEQQGREVQERIDDTRQEWEAKRADGSVPGANPPPRDEPADDVAGDGGPAGSSDA